MGNFAIPSGSGSGSGSDRGGARPANGQDPGYDKRYAPIPPSRKREGEGAAAASLVLGIFSVLGSCLWFVGLPLAVIGLALGVKGREGTAKGVAVAGIVLCVIGVVLSLAFGALHVAGTTMSTGGGG